MTVPEQVTYEVFCLSLAALVLAVIELLLLCCVLKQIRNRNITEMQISAEQPSRKLTVRTKPDHADQLLDHLLDRVFLQGNAGLASGGESPADVESQTGGEFKKEVGLEPQKNLREGSGSYPEASTSTSHPQRAVNPLHNRLQQWFQVTAPGQHEKKRHFKTASHQTSSVDQTNNTYSQQSHESQHGSSSSKGPSSTASSEEDK
ncbi:uncharacterized protein LOC101478466 isoform X1 [Maylandia zebra]|uniref:uncharacterized protein LOC101478466 isoform X1 n=1 Tax=Maylandia zebra TaxID=106582 RepID=UPI00032A1455|nr:uncharacterized protein LOC101478466 isoform X1 [Maylandia zebra]